MKVAVLGDIHGNILAFRSILSEIKKKGIEHLLITGDIIGYYYHPDKIIKELNDFTYDMVKGNHEQMFCDIVNGNIAMEEIYLDKYGMGLEYAKKLLDEDEKKLLTQLPHKKTIYHNDRKILLCHGSPWKIDEYIYPEFVENRFTEISDQGFDIVIMGHTHHPMQKYINSTLVINPGSVGQPRNYCPGADWLILDLKTLGVQQMHTHYDVELVVAEVKNIDPQIPYNADALIRTREK